MVTSFKDGIKYPRGDPLGPHRFKTVKRGRWRPPGALARGWGSRTWTPSAFPSAGRTVSLDQRPLCSTRVLVAATLQRTPAIPPSSQISTSRGRFLDSLMCFWRRSGWSLFEIWHQSFAASSVHRRVWLLTWEREYSGALASSTKPSEDATAAISLKVSKGNLRSAGIC